MTLIKFILSIAFIFSLNSAFAQDTLTREGASPYNHTTECIDSPGEPSRNQCKRYMTCRTPLSGNNLNDDIYEEDKGFFHCMCGANPEKRLPEPQIGNMLLTDFYQTAMELSFTTDGPDLARIKEETRAICLFKLEKNIQEYNKKKQVSERVDVESLTVKHKCSPLTICYSWRDLNHNKTQDFGEFEELIYNFAGF